MGIAEFNMAPRPGAGAHASAQNSRRTRADQHLQYLARAHAPPGARTAPGFYQADHLVEEQ